MKGKLGQRARGKVMGKVRVTVNRTVLTSSFWPFSVFGCQSPESQSTEFRSAYEQHDRTPSVLSHRTIGYTVLYGWQRSPNQDNFPSFECASSRAWWLPQEEAERRSSADAACSLVVHVGASARTPKAANAERDRRYSLQRGRTPGRILRSDQTLHAHPLYD